MPTVLESAREYRAKDMQVLGLSQGKKVTDFPWREYQNRPATELEITDWFRDGLRNIAILTGPISGGLVVVDIDSEEGLRIADKKLPPTPMQSETWSGGRHRFYHCSEPIGNGVKILGTDIDFRGKNGYVVAPPSRYQGRLYTWKGELVRPSELPEIDPALFSKGLPNGSTMEIRAPKAYVMTIRSIAGQGGDKAAYRVACVLADSGMPFTSAWDAYLRWNQQCASPCWREGTLQRNLENAYARRGPRVERLRLQLRGSIGMLMVERAGTDKCLLCKDKTPKKGMHVKFMDDSLTGFLCNRHALRAIEARSEEESNGHDIGRQDGAV